MKGGKKMKNKLKNQALALTLMIGLMFGTMGVIAYDVNNPYTVDMNFIVGQDTSFTVSLAGSETTIDFSPATKDSKEVEPDSQSATGTTPIATIANTGNVNLDFTHKVNQTMFADVKVTYNNANTINWDNLLTSDYSTIETAISPAGESTLYLWANFTDSSAGTRVLEYQVNSTDS